MFSRIITNKYHKNKEEEERKQRKNKGGTGGTCGTRGTPKKLAQQIFINEVICVENHVKNEITHTQMHYFRRFQTRKSREK